MEFKNGIVAQKSLLNKKEQKYIFLKKILVSNDDYIIILWYNKIFFLNLKIIQANKPRLKKISLKLQPFASVVKLVDAPDSKSGMGNHVSVQVRPEAPAYIKSFQA